MEVRSIEQGEMLPMHHGSTPVWWLVEPRAMKEQTAGGYLELVAEFAVNAGSAVEPHSHNTHEYYYMLSGRGIMVIEGEEREVVSGDFIYIPPNKEHSLRTASNTAGIRALVFAVGLADTPEYDYSVN